ncbi:MAG: ABC transporter permease [Ruminococcus sp.]|nr:ABC transporter permease [Ruminococcus sp.]
MKFINLLKKELSELITVQMIVSFVAIMAMFMILGNVMSSTIEEATKQEYTIAISDRDETEFTQSLIKQMEDNGAKVTKISTSGEDYAAILKDNNSENLVIIPEGFTSDIESGTQPKLITVSRMNSTAMLSNLSSDTSGAAAFIRSCISSTIASQLGLTGEDIDLMEDPVAVEDNTVVDDKSAPISSDSIIQRVMIQNEILPIIVFVLIMLTSQTLISAISNEKIDKTLETLLSAPVSRLAIISSKMLAAAIIALLNAAVFMIGFSTTVSGAADKVTEQVSAEGLAISNFMSVESAMAKLGLTLSFTDYILVGLQLFFTIMICLSLSIILGSLVNDTKGSQTVIMPLMMMAMIPYFISMFADINSLPTIVRIVVYAIPFTHTFSAMSNLMFGHTTIFFAGLVYQIIFFAVCLFLALRLFNSDKILTISLNFGQKSKYKKKKGAPTEE